MIACTGDMPLQLDNSGYLGIVVTLICRNCRITVATRHDLDFDVLGQTRAYMEMMRLRRALDGKRTKQEKQAFSTLHGLSLEALAVLVIAPALDIIGGRPGDTCHILLGVRGDTALGQDGDTALGQEPEIRLSYPLVIDIRRGGPLASRHRSHHDIR
jgi:hypothetical protein